MQRRVIHCEIGTVGIWGEDGIVEKITFSEIENSNSDAEGLLQAEQEIREYLKGQRRMFSFPYRLQTEGFQKDCLLALMKVPYGTTVSYAELAAMAGSPGAARAVGNAMHRNPLPILIPCHRVIKSDGGIGGFGGGMEVKRFMLLLEGGWPQK